MRLPKGATRVIGLSLGKLSPQMINLINLWLKRSGPEWTVKRLKALRTGAYQLRAGERNLAREIWQTESIAYDHHTLVPKGIFGVLITRFLLAQKPANIRRYDAGLRVYTCIYARKLTSTQYEKARKSITGDFTGDDIFLQDLAARLERYAKHYFSKKAFGMPDKVKVDLSKMSLSSTTHSEGGPFDSSIRQLPWGSHVASLWTSVYLPDELKKVNPAEKLRSLMEESGAERTISGHISFIQEGGCKARVVAVPNVWIQLLMMELDQFLDHISQRIPESCSHEQNKGGYFMKNAFEKGETVYCFDLSSATDRFPLVLQQAFLRAIGLGPYADAIEKISRGDWRVRVNLNDSKIDEIWSYRVGQPMGMYASFKLFHITHILLLKMLSRELKVKDSFRVLGDDVVITSKPLAQTYNQTLQRLGVEISKTKSMISNRIAEFAGFVCYQTNKGVALHRPFKYSGATGFGAAIPLLYAFGKKVESLGKWYLQKYMEFSHTMSWRNPDLSPLIHEDEETGVSSLNSHLLGSIGNRLSYFLYYAPNDELLSCYEEQQVILLGQKETVNSDGFASSLDNAGLGVNRDLSTLTERKYRTGFQVQLASDPLMRVQNEETKKRRTQEDTTPRELAAYLRSVL